MQDFAGKVAVVTGAASGIGFALAERFAQEGMKVVLADIEEPALEAAVLTLRRGEHDVRGVRTNVANADSVTELARQAAQTHGKVHILCNNAGVAGPAVSGGAIWERSSRDWQWGLGVNLWGVINGIQAFLPAMVAHGEEGHVVNTASIAGLTSNVFGIYGVGKHAVVALTEYLYYSLREANARISASVLCPSFVATNLGAAERNRPTELANEAPAAPSPPTWASDPAIVSARSKRIEPAQAAEIVLQAVREDRFWIFTDREVDEVIRARTEGALARRNPGPTLL